MKRIEDAPIFLSTKFPYGKYKGQTFYDVIKKDVSYVEWFVRNIGVVLEYRTEKMYKTFLKKTKPDHH